ncbi:MAG: 1-aminocyclopropane-1-carboxylate deaminase [Myxococcota bacterium]
MAASALHDLVPALAGRLPRAPLGDWPSPLNAVTLLGRRVWLKREDLSTPGYAGNKIRPLELVFGAALDQGKRCVWATGAYGSNHALATVIQAPHAGLESGVILWPQPPSATARANLRATLTHAGSLTMAPSIVAFPGLAYMQGRHQSSWVMPPGAATPLGALGHAGAAVELLCQLADAKQATPQTIVLPVGSTCTSAGLLVGVALAAHLGLCDPAKLPRIHAVRVTPWPVTAPWRIAGLAVRTAALLRRLGGPDLGLTSANVKARLTVVGRYLGDGYGEPTQDGLDAALTFAHRSNLRLDTTYASKAAAYLIDALPRLPGPVVFWATKSAVPMPSVDLAAIKRAPGYVARWLTQRG